MTHISYKFDTSCHLNLTTTWTRFTHNFDPHLTRHQLNTKLDLSDNPLNLTQTRTQWWPQTRPQISPQLDPKFDRILDPKLTPPPTYQHANKPWWVSREKNNYWQTESSLAEVADRRRPLADWIFKPRGCGASRWPWCCWLWGRWWAGPERSDEATNRVKLKTEDALKVWREIQTISRVTWINYAAHSCKRHILLPPIYIYIFIYIC